MSKKTKIRQRFQYKFWLDAYVQAEYSLMETIEALKAERKFAVTMRNALRLIIDLSSGNIDVLLELFPWVVERIGATQPAPVSQPPAPDTSELAKEIATQLILRGGKDTLQMIQGGQQQDSNRTGQGTGKQLAAPQFALPVFDDDSELPTIITKGSTSVDSSLNFITALQHMQ